MVVVVIVVLVGLSYVVSTRIHPLRKCPTCNMSGRHFGSVYKGSYRRCRRCSRCRWSFPEWGRLREWR